MTWWQAVLLGALQGVTEFLPISSSGHLVLAQHLLGFSDQNAGEGAALFFDGALHLGTVVAVLIYLYRGWKREQGEAETASLWPDTMPGLFYLAVLVGLASLPATLAALLRSEQIKESFNNPHAVGVNFLILGALLLATDYLPAGTTRGLRTRWWQALIVGVGQAVAALFRGMSRSGSTIAVALVVGLERGWAVRFSFLMSVVASVGLGGLGVVKALRDPTSDSWLTTEFLGLTFLGTFASGVVGYLSIAPLIWLVRRARLWWFAVYLWIVGASVLLLR